MTTMTRLTRRRFLALPAHRLRHSMRAQSAFAAQMAGMLAEMNQLMQSWPDRAQETPKTMTLEELTLKTLANDGVGAVLAKMIGLHTQQIRHLYWLVGGKTYPPAKGDV